MRNMHPKLKLLWLRLMIVEPPKSPSVKNPNAAMESTLSDPGVCKINKKLSNRKLTKSSKKERNLEMAKGTKMDRDSLRGPKNRRKAAEFLLKGFYRHEILKFLRRSEASDSIIKRYTREEEVCFPSSSSLLGMACTHCPTLVQATATKGWGQFQHLRTL